MEGRDMYLNLCLSCLYTPYKWPSLLLVQRTRLEMCSCLSVTVVHCQWTLLLVDIWNKATNCIYALFVPYCSIKLSYSRNLTCTRSTWVGKMFKKPVSCVIYVLWTAPTVGTGKISVPCWIAYLGVTLINGTLRKVLVISTCYCRRLWIYLSLTDHVDQLLQVKAY